MTDPPPRRGALPEVEVELDGVDPPQDWRVDAQEQLDRARDWVVRNPYAALGIAVAAGFLVGRIVRRR